MRSASVSAAESSRGKGEVRSGVGVVRYGSKATGLVLFASDERCPFETLVGIGGTGGSRAGVSGVEADRVDCDPSLVDASESERPILDLIDFLPRRVHPLPSFSFGVDGVRGYLSDILGVVDVRVGDGVGADSKRGDGGCGNEVAFVPREGRSGAVGIGTVGKNECAASTGGLDRDVRRAWTKSPASSSSPRPFSSCTVAGRGAVVETGPRFGR